MDTDLLKPHPGATHKKKRVGRGNSSGHGGTSTRGHKGQRARSKVAKWFEGGQMPLVRRIPKRGFHPPAREKLLTVNVEKLNVFKAGSEVDPEAMRKAGLVSRRGKPKVVILGVEDYLRNIVKKPRILAEIQRDAQRAGLDKMTDEEIQTEIEGSRTSQT